MLLCCPSLLTGLQECCSSCFLAVHGYYEPVRNMWPALVSCVVVLPDILIHVADKHLDRIKIG